jgi:hypothetical protein
MEKARGDLDAATRDALSQGCGWVFVSRLKSEEKGNQHEAVYQQ